MRELCIKKEIVRKMNQFKDQEMDDLFEGILALETIEECYQFFVDLCTANELLSMKQRLQVAKLIRSGETYTHIQEKTGSSSTTISRVKRCLDYGENGYHLVLDRVDADIK